MAKEKPIQRETVVKLNRDTAHMQATDVGYAVMVSMRNLYAYHPHKPNQVFMFDDELGQWTRYGEEPTTKLPTI